MKQARATPVPRLTAQQRYDAIKALLRDPDCHDWRERLERIAAERAPGAIQATLSGSRLGGDR